MPPTTRSGQLLLADLYVFRGDVGTVLVMDVNSDVTGLRAEPGFHPGARYEFQLHFDRAGRQSLTYRVTFGDADGRGRQPLDLHVLTCDHAGDGEPGELVLSGRTGEPVTANGIRLWAGRVGDPFYVDLALLSMVTSAVARGIAPDLAAWDPADAQNSFSGTTVESIVIEIPDSGPLLRPGARTGVWGATRLAAGADGWRLADRVGHPMMGSIFRSGDAGRPDPADHGHPSRDVAEEAGRLAGAVAAVTAAAGTVGDPRAYGAAVARELLPDMLPYVVGMPATFGFAARNGRALADNVPEVMLSLVTGTAVPTGLTPGVSGHLRRGRFPYLVPA
ncbi:DUF4331 family protein [Actinomadura sp. NPDC049753]|uniref:DUF4331 family protein n=1 Tax=Actinomadura sp. NPDC049753 TaxID=3154739 RepID=UPI0034200E10